MVINKEDIVSKENGYDNCYLTDLDLAYSRYGNNYNIICENIEFEDINLKDVNNWSVLYCAVRGSNRHSTLETVGLILKYKPNINAKIKCGFTALHACCININSLSNIKTLKLLLEHNADVNLVDNCGETPLFDIVKFKNLKAIKLLLKYSAKINIKNNYNKSAIDILIDKYKFNFEITQTLLTFDKNINYKFTEHLDFNFVYKN
jgi:ankyrin repeat protein